jgi:hypothetical protein
VCVDLSLDFGLRRALGKASDFEDDEYVVFASNQQYISHLVEFALKQGTVVVSLTITSSSITTRVIAMLERA